MKPYLLIRVSGVSEVGGEGNDRVACHRGLQRVVNYAHHMRE